MKMLSTRQVANQESKPYATRADFCRIFAKEMNHFYLLAFLLTADHSIAERCFVSGLDESGKGNPVFKEWAESWARRTIIQSAIQMTRPRPLGSSASSSTSGRSSEQAIAAPAVIADIVKLAPFERFAFVMSVLESCSDQECSLLLHCTRGEVMAARTRALQQIGTSAELQRKLADIAASEQAPRDVPVSLTQLEAISHLAAST